MKYGIRNLSSDFYFVLLRRKNDSGYMKKSLKYGLWGACLGLIPISGFAQREQQVNLQSFVEFGSTVYTGDYTPLWQVSNRQGLGSLENSAYLRSGVVYCDQWGRWNVEAGLDLIGAKGTASGIQQAYGDFRYKWLGILVGAKEMNAPLMNAELSSGEMTWSGNAKPIPQIMVGLPDYVYLLKRLAIRGEISYGWFTDGDWLDRHASVQGYHYVKGIKYHHKEGFVRIGIPGGKWQLDFGMTMNNQFGGTRVTTSGEQNLGNGLKNYWRAFIPSGGDEEVNMGDAIFYQGNTVGSEQIRGTYRGNRVEASLYLDNFFDDFSGMGKQNGWDGLWGLELHFPRFRVIENVVLEYLQTTNTSGPLHGLHNPGEGPVQKTGGGDNYYNNFLYHSWSHWGMANGNPLLRSPVYNENGQMQFLYNRVKALHAGWKGQLVADWNYTAKLTWSRTWGGTYRPTLDILHNVSAYLKVDYKPHGLQGWRFEASLALDRGNIYGDNYGLGLKIRKEF